MWISAILICTITVPASVKKIGDKAFYYAEKLNAISFASGSVLEQIGDFAFERCKALEFIALPQGVKTLGESVFKNCTALGYLQLSKSHFQKEFHELLVR